MEPACVREARNGQPLRACPEHNADPCEERRCRQFQCRPHGTRSSLGVLSQDFRPGLSHPVPCGTVGVAGGTSPQVVSTPCQFPSNVEVLLLLSFFQEAKWRSLYCPLTTDHRPLSTGP